MHGMLPDLGIDSAVKMTDIIALAPAAAAAEDEEAAACAVAFVIFYHYQQKRIWKYRSSYEYISHSFSLNSMPPGRARIWLRFTPAEVQQLVPLLGLEEIQYRNKYPFAAV